MFKFLFYRPLRQLLTFKNTLAFLFQTQEDTDQNRKEKKKKMAGSSNLQIDIQMFKTYFYLLSY